MSRTTRSRRGSVTEDSTADSTAPVSVRTRRGSQASLAAASTEKDETTKQGEEESTPHVSTRGRRRGSTSANSETAMTDEVETGPKKRTKGNQSIESSQEDVSSQETPAPTPTPSSSKKKSIADLLNEAEAKAKDEEKKTKTPGNRAKGGKNQKVSTANEEEDGAGSGSDSDDAVVEVSTKASKNEAMQMMNEEREAAEKAKEEQRLRKEKRKQAILRQLEEVKKKQREKKEKQELRRMMDERGVDDEEVIVGKKRSRGDDNAGGMEDDSDDDVDDVLPSEVFVKAAQDAQAKKKEEELMMEMGGKGKGNRVGQGELEQMLKELEAKESRPKRSERGYDDLHKKDGFYVTAHGNKNSKQRLAELALGKVSSSKTNADASASRAALVGQLFGSRVVRTGTSYKGGATPYTHIGNSNKLGNVGSSKRYTPTKSPVVDDDEAILADAARVRMMMKQRR